MSMRDGLLPAAIAAVLLTTASVWAEPPAVPRLGTALGADAASRLPVTIFPDGRGLPPGRGTATDGAAIYDAKCSNCHGPEGRGETADELAADAEPLSDPDAPQTIGSYWPYATTLFDYVRRAMPMDKPGSLTDDEVYALSAYLLALNGVVPKDATMDAAEIAKVRMPNRDGFEAIDAK
jgi:mono/diheme cytochrome c family protein